MLYALVVAATLTFCPATDFQWAPGHGSAEGGVYEDGTRYILFDPDWWRELKPVQRKFILAHECSHAMNIEHRKLFSRDEELAADKDAFERGVREKWIRRESDVSKICRALGTETQSETHPSSWRRCLELWRLWASHKQNSKKR